MIEITREDNKLILKPEQDLTGDIIKKFREELSKNLEDESVELIFDLSSVQLIDSTGLALLVASQKTLEEKNKLLTLINVNEEIFDLLRLTHLDRFFNIG